MTTIAVVPIQHLTVAKSRLRDRLNPSERRSLVLSLLRHVLASLETSTLVDETLVVTPDPAVVQAATALGQVGLLQTGVGLNAAIRQGRDEAVRRGAETVLVMLGDLPLVTVADIDALVEAVSESGIVLAPDRHQRGTNVLVLRPPSVLDPLFGPDSFQAHRLMAKRRGLHVREYRALGTGFDIDESIDLDQLERLRARNRAVSQSGESRHGYPADLSGLGR